MTKAQKETKNAASVDPNTGDTQAQPDTAVAQPDESVVVEPAAEASAPVIKKQSKAHAELTSRLDGTLDLLTKVVAEDFTGVDVDRATSAVRVYARALTELRGIGVLAA